MSAVPPDEPVSNPERPVAGDDGAWHRLGRALQPRGTRSQVLAAVLCALLGFALVVQLRSTQEGGLDQLREEDLVRYLADSSERAQRLGQEEAELEETLRLLESDSDQREAALTSAQERLDALGILAGTAPATGPGVEVSVVDPEAGVTASILLASVQELRDSSAEAISIGDARVVASTAFVDAGDGVLVDDVLVTSPFVVRAIGDPARIEATLGIPGGVLSLLETAGAQAVVEQLDEVRVEALRVPSEPGYARPQPSAPADD